jgi:GNS1/SUR4 family
MAPYGEAYFTSFLNSFIHVIMYSYYLCSSLGIAKSITKAVKPFITMGQMTQFLLMLCQASYDFYLVYFVMTEEEKKEAYPPTLVVLLWLYMWTMLGLFGNFFIQTYRKPAASAEKKVGKPIVAKKEE